MIITIFTPTYNRAHLLPNVYESLQQQKQFNFEWIVVDDGSNDDTTEVMKNIMLQHKKSFKIQYHYQHNRGKHTAINKGLQVAQGELFCILDSDDTLNNQAVSYINKAWQQLSIEGKDRTYGGIVFDKYYKNGKTIGTPDLPAIMDCSITDYRFKHQIIGDKFEVFITKLLQQFPFPETEGEKFCPEALVWNRIGHNTLFRFINQSIYEVEYLEGGLTANIVKIRANSPINTTLYYQELTQYHIPLKQKIKAAINFWRFYYYCNQSKRQLITHEPKVILNILAKPLGYALFKKEHKAYSH
jgi:glycosyltransferase involved in cell wall biosynthesis